MRGGGVLNGDVTEWIQLVQYRVQWQALDHTVMKLWILKIM